MRKNIYCYIVVINKVVINKVVVNKVVVNKVNKVVVNKVVVNKVVINKVVINKFVVASNNHMISPHSTCVSLCTLASRILSDMSSLCILLKSSANLCKGNRAEIT